MAPVDEASRFWANVDKGPDDVCWPWLAARFESGYGAFHARGRQWRAHRFAWMLARGEAIAPGLLVLHRCDNPPCVNPAHLFLGTPSDNMQDKLRKGRESHVRGYHKLTTAQVSAIRSRLGAGETQAAIAAHFGVDQATISRIDNGKIWRVKS